MITKHEARSKGLASRHSIPSSVKADYDRLLFARMKEYAGPYQLVGCYVSFGEEADTHAFLNWCFETGRAVAVPKVYENTLRFLCIKSMDDLAPGTFGVMEPFRGTEVPASDIDLMFVPLSSFDEAGNRTGYGRGYYDSVLTDTMVKVGIAYPQQKVDLMERDPWDVPLDVILLP